MPDDIGVTVPVDACRMQDAPGFNSTKAPCLDAQLRAGVPNVVKQVGANIVTTTHGIAGELRDGEPLLSEGKPARITRHIGEARLDVEDLTKTRPTIGVAANPRHTGIVDMHSPDGKFLEAEIGPRQSDHQGVSAGDTSLALDAAHGYTVGPVARPDELLKHDLSGGNLPRVGDVVPAAGKVADMAKADELTAVPGQIVHNVATGLPQIPGQR
ncbi:hypothetical protein OOZ19_18460 [Saccharopolyspora sp. NFXS83]|uniref:hypothetical protein n=1 Tax=Saccharopolyspora sp. NFXS83 TaxID=2993560 RepID=UPI00224B54F0|nr:hypothetical protein [Saccharopolyspora sp. NFXS83]MCX2732225.1 hypothetical protein [Saccharopolyspora sp. NFXS83]